MTIDQLARRLERLRERSHSRNTRLPVRYYDEDGNLLYQTPGYDNQDLHINWKVYIGNPDDDGSEL